LKPITVNKRILLDKLVANRAIHNAEYEELMIDYNDKAIVDLQILLDKAKLRPVNVESCIRLDKPKSYDNEYETIIGMLEIANETTFELDRSNYEKYILNKWDWSNSFAQTKMSYGKF